MTGIAGVNSNYELAVKFLGHAATSGEQDPSVTHGHRPAADATGGEGGDEKADKERTQECSYAHIVGAGWKAAKHVMNVALIKRL